MKFDKRRTTSHLQNTGQDKHSSASVRSLSFVWCDFFLLIISFQFIIFVLLSISTPGMTSIYPRTCANAERCLQFYSRLLSKSYIFTCMTLAFSLNENDFLQHQLFIASKSERIKKKRIKSWLFASISVLFIAFLFYQNGNMFMTYCSLGLLGYTIIFYPLYLKSHYKNHYKKFIAESYKERVGIEATMTVGDNQIELFDRSGESKINLSEISEMTETGEYIYLSMKTGENLIIPKLKIDNTDVVRKELKTLAEKLGVGFTSELEWKWK